MSEFECRCGGLVVGGKCTDCEHPRIVRMDGLTAKQLTAKAMARIEAEYDLSLNYEEETHDN